MSADRISTLVFVYNSFGDPLFQNLVFQYLKELSKDPKIDFHVITFEQKEYNIPDEKKKKFQQEFQENGLYWYPLDYAYGRVLLLNKFRNLVDAFLQVRKINRDFHPEFILSFGNVAAAFGGLLSTFFGFKSIIIQYEPHHLFLLELNRWSDKSLKYKVLSSLEEFARKRADFIMTGTSHMINDLESKGTKAKLFRTPNAVDENLMRFDPNARTDIRNKFRIEQNDVFIYIGKLGELYYEEELVEVCSAIYKHNKKAFFLVITGYDHEVLREWFVKWEVPNESFLLMMPVVHFEVPKFLSAADMGMVAIPPTPAQKFRSPLKTADYLYCGLPYLICRGISEDDDYARRYQLGVVIDKYSAEEIDIHYSEIANILNGDKTELRRRCREIGLDYRDRKKVLSTLMQIILSE